MPNQTNRFNAIPHLKKNQRHQISLFGEASNTYVPPHYEVHIIFHKKLWRSFNNRYIYFLTNENMIYKYQWCNIDLISDIQIHWNEWTMRWKQYKMFTAESVQRSSCRDNLLTREYLGTSLIVYCRLNLLNFFFLLIFFLVGDFIA